MPVYQFKGFDRGGKPIAGLRDADGVKSLRFALRKEGILATEVEESVGGVVAAAPSGVLGWISKPLRLRQIFQRVSVEELALATRQLATLLQAAVPLVDALGALVEQVSNEQLKRVFSDIKSKVNEGASLADAMATHGKVFSNVYINMVRAGESSGTLEVVLERLADFTESQAQLRSRVMSAMLYPSIMVGVGFLVMIVMFTTVIPRISTIFAQANAKLPFMTTVLIGISNFMASFWWLVIGLVALLVYGFFRWKKTPKGRAVFDRFQLKAPIFGEIVQMVSVARFARTLSTLMAAGVPLLTSLQIVRNVVNNDALEKAIDNVRDAVKEGEDIATPLKNSGRFPPMVTHMISIGERSGQLENMLARVASSYEQRVQVRVGMLTSLLEPIMILIMGATVGFIVFAILMPIMQMSQVVGQ
jgi:general secretion pathway protein F